EDDNLSSGSDDSLHVPVLLSATLGQLKPTEGESYLDLTAGYGGHASRILGITGNYQNSVLVDRDDYAIEHLSHFEQKGAKLLHADFVSAATELIGAGQRFDMVLVDLGVSSPQLDQIERGFSFRGSGPLDMRMDRRQTSSAKTLVNSASQEELSRIIQDYGEESSRLSRQIAAAIVEARPLETTEELANVISQLFRGRKGRIHPATRTFQAIRIAVNQELTQ